MNFCKLILADRVLLKMITAYVEVDKSAGDIESLTQCLNLVIFTSQCHRTTPTQCPDSFFGWNNYKNDPKNSIS